MLAQVETALTSTDGGSETTHFPARVETAEWTLTANRLAPLVSVAVSADWDCGPRAVDAPRQRHHAQHQHSTTTTTSTQVLEHQYVQCAAPQSNCTGAAQAQSCHHDNLVAGPVHSSQVTTYAPMQKQAKK